MLSEVSIERRVKGRMGADALGFAPLPPETHVNGKNRCAALFAFGRSPWPSPSLLHLPRVRTSERSPLSLSLPRTTQWTTKSTSKPVANTRASVTLQPLDFLHPNEEQEEIGRLTEGGRGQWVIDKWDKTPRVIPDKQAQMPW